MLEVFRDRRPFDAEPGGEAATSVASNGEWVDGRIGSEVLRGCVARVEASLAVAGWSPELRCGGEGMGAASLPITS